MKKALFLAPHYGPEPRARPAQLPHTGDGGFFDPQQGLECHITSTQKAEGLLEEWYKLAKPVINTAHLIGG